MAPKKKRRTAPRDWKDLAELLYPPFLDFCQAKLEEGDEHILKLLRDFKARRIMCVFCECPFDPRSPGDSCSVSHCVEDWDAERTRHSPWGSRYEYSGTCTRCGEDITKSGSEDDVPADDDLGECYTGPHCGKYPAGFWKGDPDDDPAANEDEEEEEEEQEEDEIVEIDDDRGDAVAVVRAAASACEKGCGRPRYQQYSTCCTHCSGPSGPHARDCEAKARERLHS